MKDTDAVELINGMRVYPLGAFHAEVPDELTMLRAMPTEMVKQLAENTGRRHREGGCGCKGDHGSDVDSLLERIMKMDVEAALAVPVVRVEFMFQWGDDTLTRSGGLLNVTDHDPAGLREEMFRLLMNAVTDKMRHAFQSDGVPVFTPDTDAGNMAWEVLSARSISTVLDEHDKDIQALLAE